MLLLVITSNLIFGATTYYVTTTGLSTNTGTTWGTAKSLQGALDVAVSGDQIWVAAGTYKPGYDYGLGGGTRYYHFRMKSGVAIYGGFAGTETAVSQRINFGSGEANETILSGDIGTVEVNSDNCYHVFFHPSGLGLTSTAILDGFTIIGGNANLGSTEHQYGGGIYNNSNSQTIINCTIKNNAGDIGSGIYNIGSSPVITNCIFEANQNEALFNTTTSSPVITNCIFRGNTYGIYNIGSSQTIANSIFNGNSIAGICNNSSSSPTIMSSTFSGNGTGMTNDGSSAPTVTNTIFWGNTTQITGGTASNFTYCCIQGGSGTYTGTGNIFTDALFVSNNNLRLKNTSKCIGAGTSTGAPATDIEGNIRPNPTGTNPDIGAYENSYSQPGPIFVKAGATGTNEGTSWTDAYTSLQDALDDASSGHEIWVAVGTYKPTFAYDLSGTRYYHFRMINGVEIFGGFDGVDDDDLSDRSITGNETILSGDLSVNDVYSTWSNMTDNCYHVFYHPSGLGLTSTAVLDGFIIKGGNANLGSTDHQYGGGIYNNSNSPTIINCTIKNNAGDIGSGIYNIGSSPVITNCIFEANQNEALFNTTSSSPGITKCIFRGNKYGVYNSSSSPAITNCSFNGNSSYGNYNYSSSSPTIMSCTFNGNGTGIMNYDASSAPTLTNTIFWGNTTQISGGTASNFTYCCIQGGNTKTYPGTGNIFTDPLFVDADGADNTYGTSDDDLRLKNISKCIGAGTSTGAPTTDIEGNSRPDPTGTVPDIGAYEHSYGEPGPLYVNDNAPGTNEGTSWTNAFISLQPALDYASSGFEIWVAAGTYKPSYDYGLGGGSRYYHFRMIEGVAIYGGFDGVDDDELSDRSIGSNKTILSGDLSGNDNYPDPTYMTDNCYHIFYHPSGMGLTNVAILNGFTITGGYAYGSSPYDAGGAIYNISNSPTIINCTISKNTGSSSNGSAIYNGSSSPQITNCLFENNEYIGLFNYSSSPAIWNCTFNGNNTGLYNRTSSNPTVTNTIFWGNTTEIDGDDITSNFTYCCIQDGSGTYTGTGNIYTNPLFVSSRNFALQDNSPCIGTGIKSGSPATDILGATRGTPPDIGAYENSYDSPLPVELNLFTASVKVDKVILNWNTATEVNNYGFEIQRSPSPAPSQREGDLTLMGDWGAIGFVEGHGNSNSTKEYSFYDKITESGKYSYRLKQIDTDGNFKYSSEIEIDVKILLQSFALEQNFPNPFNPTTKIKFAVPNVETSYMTSLRIYNILGKEIITLINKELSAGEYEIEFSAEQLGSGIYFYNLRHGDKSITKKMHLMK
ncbi:MAG: T9SS C-terminal target domain-containing protein [Ignavibacteriales bacterium]|nr:MAG: T9SS C-terminal target domain-containing protein [Ignavibacteriales bacterium]